MISLPYETPAAAPTGTKHTTALKGEWMWPVDGPPQTGMAEIGVPKLAPWRQWPSLPGVEY